MTAKECVKGIRCEASTDTMIWTAVVANSLGTYVSGPRWMWGLGAQLAQIVDGQLIPFPNTDWNNWKTGDDPKSKFINISSLRDDGAGGLWVVDSGTLSFGGSPIVGATKIVHIDLAHAKITHVIQFPNHVLNNESYLDKIRLHDDHAYITDSGSPGIVVLNFQTGETRRILENHSSTTAGENRPIVVAGEVLRTANGQPLKVHVDPMELSIDKEWLFYGPLSGPWSKIPTSVLKDSSLSAEQISSAVQPFADIPPTGGCAMDKNGNIYFSDLKNNAIGKCDVAGNITRVVQDSRLHWVDAMYISKDDRLWMPVAQVDRLAVFNKSGKSEVQWPVGIYSISI